MNVIPYRITLLEPLLATRVDGDPNSAVSHPYLPGSMVRGAAVRAYLSTTGQRGLDAGGEDAQRLFFNGQARYLNAYPVTSTGQRMLPTPHSWFTVKGEEDLIYDFAQSVRRIVDGETKQFSAVVNEARPFCWVEGGQVHFYAPQRRVNVHTQRDRLMGRAREGSGAVFQYDAIEAGEQFAGFVLVNEQGDVDLIKSLLRHVSMLGGSSNSGYGRVQVDVGEPIDLAETSWRETPGRVAAAAPRQLFVVTVLSDTLVRSQQTGQYTSDLKQALQAALGLELQTPSSLEDTAIEEEQQGARRIREVGGFNRTWGLPLPQAQAVSAGSVYVFTAHQSIDPEAIARAEWQGIGERRSEGYGRLAFDWQADAELHLTKPRSLKLPATPPALSGPAEEMAKTMVLRMLTRDLDAALRKRVNNLEIHHAPSNAQLSRLRIIAREALPSGDIDRLRRLVQSINERRTPRVQFESARIGKKRLGRWLTERLETPASVWDELGVSNLERSLGSNVRLSAKDNEALAREYTIRLIDGVLAKAAQQRRVQEEDER